MAEDKTTQVPGEAEEAEEAALPEPPEPPPLPLDYETACEIELTPQQQAIVKAETGREMKVLVLEDGDGNFARHMSGSSPDDFTILAIRQATRLNEYDADYHKYLEALAAWQASLNEPDPADAMVEAAQIAALQEAERLRLFFQAETEACQNAREMAKIYWGKKDKPSA